MRIIGIIPARMGSTRFPGKPLADIHGKPMLQHVYEACMRSVILDGVFVATCDDEIKQFCDSISASCVMTSSAHERCSDRTAEAMLKIEESLGSQVVIVVMIQGDEPMITPTMVDDAVKALEEDKHANVVNLMGRLHSVDEFQDPNEVKVVVDLNGYALYFSREPIPSVKKGVTDVPMLKQVCIIPFRRDSLLQFNEIAPTPLEEIESVDMMRLLEHGEKVKMVYADEVTYSVDTPADLKNVITLMKEKPAVSSGA